MTFTYSATGNFQRIMRNCHDMSFCRSIWFNKIAEVDPYMQFNVFQISLYSDLDLLYPNTMHSTTIPGTSCHVYHSLTFLVPLAASMAVVAIKSRERKECRLKLERKWRIKDLFVPSSFSLPLLSVLFSLLFFFPIYFRPFFELLERMWCIVYEISNCASRTFSDSLFY